MEKDAKIYVAGHLGLVGSAIVRALEKGGYSHLVVRTQAELDLCDQAATRHFFKAERPEYVFLAAAKVGGIQANNNFRADFIYENVVIQTNVIRASHEYGVTKLLFLGSSCIYPRECPQPIKEEYLLTGPLEATNEPYAIAKIAGIKMCEAFNTQYGAHFISVMPTNLYGPNDNFDLETSHVLPALIRKFVEAAEEGRPYVTLWGSGKVRREFLHVDDAADAFLFLMGRVDGGLYNVGVGEDMTILELAELVRELSAYKGELRFDSTKPDGTPRKLLNVNRILSLGWKPGIGLREGISATLRWFKENRRNGLVKLRA